MRTVRKIVSKASIQTADAGINTVFVLKGSAASAGSPSNPDIGTNVTFNIHEGANASITKAGVDTFVNFEGFSSEFEIRILGRTVIVHSADQEVRIALSGNHSRGDALHMQFADGSYLVYNAKGWKIEGDLATPTAKTGVIKVLNSTSLDLDTFTPLTATYTDDTFPSHYTVASHTGYTVEGGVALFEVTATGAATSADFSLSGLNITSADIDSIKVNGTAVTLNNLSGTANLNSAGVAVIEVTLKADATTEGKEQLSLSVGNQTAYALVDDTSLSASTYAIAGPNSVDEGSVAVFAVTTSHVAAGTPINYTLDGISAADVQGGALHGTTFVGADGKAYINVALVADAKTEGTENLTVTLDGLNQTTSSTVNDTSKSVQATVTALSADTGSNSTDFITSSASQTVSGIYTGVLEIGGRIQVSADGSMWADAIVNTIDKTWSADVTLTPTSTNLSVRAVDFSGNTTAGNGHSYTLDSTAPTAIATVSALSPDTGVLDSDFITNIAAQTVTGSYNGVLNSDEKIQVSADDTNWVDVKTDATTHTWSADVTLSDSGSNLNVRTIDLAGNTTVGNGHSYTLDSTAPAAVATVESLSADTGILANDFITNIAAQTVTGSYNDVLDSGEKIQVSVDDTNWVDVKTEATTNTWSADVTLSDSGSNLSVRTIDLAGNTTMGIDHSYTLLTFPATVATVSALSADTGVAGDFITKTTAQTVTGSYDVPLGNGEKIQVSVDGSNWIDATANTIANTWSANVSLIASGTDVSVRTINLSGKSTAGIGHSYTLDSTAPAAVATVAALSADTGISTNDFITMTAAQTVTGSYSGALGASEKIQVSVDGTNWVDTSTNTVAKTWSADVTLSASNSNLSVRTIDLAGNTVAGNGHNYTLDTVAPTFANYGFAGQPTQVYLLDYGSDEYAGLYDDAGGQLIGSLTAKGSYAGFGINVAAQSSVTNTNLKTSDTAGNLVNTNLKVVLGTANADTITGTSGTETIYGFDGDDVINGNGGADYLLGGAGNDEFHGTSATSVFDGGTGSNTLVIDDTGFDDQIYNDAQIVNIQTVNIINATGANGWFKLDNQSDGFIINNLTSAPANGVHIEGSSGADVINGSSANEIIYGDNGNDTIVGGAGADNMTGGADIDTFIQDVSDSMAITASSLTSGNLTAGDTLTFGNGVDTINDFLAGVGGDVLDVQSAAAPMSIIGTPYGTSWALLGVEYYVSGNYNAGTHVFAITNDAAGADTLIIQGHNDTFSSNHSMLLLVGVNSANLDVSNFV